MSRPKDRISYRELHDKFHGVHRFEASRTAKNGIICKGYGDTKPHAKADLRLKEVAMKQAYTSLTGNFVTATGVSTPDGAVLSAAQPLSAAS